MGRTLETAAVETKSSLPLLTTYRPLRFTWPVQPGSLDGPAVARGMKKIGFLSLGHWSRSPGSQTRTAADALQQSVELAMAAEELGADGAYFPGAPLRPATRFPVPPADRRRSPDEPDRDRHRRDPPGLPERIWWGAGTCLWTR